MRRLRVACYAENNVAIVGKEQCFMGREMSWLHIERYFEPGARHSPEKDSGCAFCPCSASIAMRHPANRSAPSSRPITARRDNNPGL